MSRIVVMGDRANIAKPGHLAAAIIKLSKPDVSIEAVRLPDKADLLVYARRVDDTLDIAHQFCASNHTPLVVMSTGIDSAIPIKPDYPLVIAPNAGLRVLRFLRRVKDQARYLKGWDIAIVEHHQPTKKDTSGTARNLAAMLGLTESAVISIRDLKTSLLAYPSITPENRTSYAAHRVTFTNPQNGNQEMSEILVLGREDYAEGLLAIYKALQREDVKQFIAQHGNRVHVVDLFEAGFLE